MTYFWNGDFVSHWSSLELADLLTLLYIGLLALFVFVTNRLFVGKFLMLDENIAIIINVTITAITACRYVLSYCVIVIFLHNSPWFPGSPVFVAVFPIVLLLVLSNILISLNTISNQIIF